MKKINFISERCFGCGACWSIAPKNFECNDEGRTEMIDDNINDESIEASEICPANAIVIESECNCDENCNCDEDCNCGCKNK